MAVLEAVEQQADSSVRAPHKLLIDGEWVEAASDKTFETNVFDAAMPFGGCKESGWGREMGHQVLNNYLETKSVVTAL